MVKGLLVGGRWLLAFVVLCATYTHGLKFQTALTSKEKSMQFFSPSFFKQKLDHFRPNDDRTFDQRYYSNLNYFNAETGPIFFYIGGEAPLYGPPSGEVEELAREFGAAVVALEHRYYGKSHPFDSSATENMKYLNTGQAMLDLVAFREFFNEELKRTNGASDKNAWITFGGSYAGGLSAWFRSFFPQYVDGAVASSGVVDLVVDFNKFDEQVAKSIGPQCTKVMRDLMKAIDQLLDSPQTNALVKQKFNAQELADGDFRYLLSDSTSMCVQYGYVERLCDPVLTAYRSSNGDMESVLDAFSSYSQNFFFTTLETGSSQEYSTQYLQNTDVSEDKSARTWLYQTCTELGWFQTAPQDGTNLRSAKVDLKYFRDHCRDVFGKELWPDTDAGNRNTGGKNIKGSNIYFINGGMDPWQHVSVTTATPQLAATVLDCNGCAHCRDLKGLQADDPAIVTSTRQEIKKEIVKWIQQKQSTVVEQK